MTKTYQKIRENKPEPEELPGYPEYSEDEDIYNKAKHEDEIDPENIHRNKESIYEDESGMEGYLDIPGSEMDDDLEDVGSEDEENNYYSLSDNDDLEDLI